MGFTFKFKNRTRKRPVPNNQKFTFINLVFFLLIYLKFLLFDFFWCYNTSFSSFSFLQGYINKLCLALCLLLPIMVFRKISIALAICILLDIFLVVNLMYFRTYYSIIPLESYGLAENLLDFTDSIYDSLSWGDLVFPLSTIVAYLLCRRKKILPTYKSREWFSYGIVFIVSIILMGGYYSIKGGIIQQDKDLQNANYFMTRTPVFTLFGSLYCEYEQKKQIKSSLPELGKQIKVWIATQPKNLPYPLPEGKSNCIIILAESLESWVLERTVEGQEITPHLNSLLKKANTIYAPKVLTQVKGGRSIDAQLMIQTGLLPIQTGAYSIKHPNNYYPSLVKAFKEHYPRARSFIMTVDKNITWNQEVIAKSFGFDSVLWKKDFIIDEKIGERKKLGDYSFLKQCASKIESTKLWAPNQNTFIQCVTYSGHNPFVLPEQLKQIFFSEKIPKRMNDYMTMANYTDKAIGNFINQLISQKKYENTLIVITGDHEGLASDRPGLCASDAGKQIVSKEKFTPLIILNSPQGLRYDKVMGQIDIYPTLLQALGLDHYLWKGLGNSILNETDYNGFAISPQMEIVGDISQIAPTSIAHKKTAWEISDHIIQQNYLQNNH